MNDPHPLRRGDVRAFLLWLALLTSAAVGPAFLAWSLEGAPAGMAVGIAALAAGSTRIARSFTVKRPRVFAFVVGLRLALSAAVVLVDAGGERLDFLVTVAMAPDIILGASCLVAFSSLGLPGVLVALLTPVAVALTWLALLTVVAGVRPPPASPRR